MRWGLALIALVGCRNVLGIPDETSVLAFNVNGKISGVVGATDKIVLTLEVSDGDGIAPIAINQDGDFTFPGVQNGAAFTIRTTPNCRVDQHDVTSVDGEDVTGMDVFCDGHTALAGVTFSAPLSLEPAFGPANLSYALHGSLLSQVTFVSIAKHYQGTGVSQIDIDGTPLETDDGLKYGIRVGSFVQAIDLDSLVNPTINIAVNSPMYPMRRTYHLALDRVAPAQFGYGKSTTSQENAGFGSAMAGDGGIVVVGVPDRAGGGAAIVYRRTGEQWTEVTTLTATGSARFGASVAVFLETIAVGAPGENNGRGAVYVYRYDGTNVTQLLRSQSISPEDGGEFGAAVAVSRFGLDNLVAVGAPGELSATGNAYKVSVSAMTVARLQADSPRVGDRIGASITWANPSNIVVGAPGDDSGLATPTDTSRPDAGAVRVFSYLSTQQTAYLKATLPGAGDAFGAAVTASYDGNAIVVGAPLEDSGSTDPSNDSASASGAAYVFYSQTADNWTQTSFVKATQISAGDGFGSSLAFEGNLLAIGAPYDDSGIPDPNNESVLDAGAAFVYRIVNATLMQPFYVKASNPGANDAFGTALAFVTGALVVGAPYEDSSATTWNGNQGDGSIDTGAIYTFR